MNVDIGRVYRHYKGKFYYVKDVVVHRETSEKMVIYQELYGEYNTWVKPLNLFVDEIDEDDSKNIFHQKHRFERVEL